MELTPEQEKAIAEQKEYCPFCKIVKGEIAATKVFEDNDFLAVLDINPGAQGHVLLLPKEHYPIMPLIPQTILAKLATITGELSHAIRKSMVSPRIDGFIANGAAAGQQSSHFLIHLLPADNPRFSLPAGTPNKQLEGLIEARYASSKEMLSKAINENPELRRMIIEQPEELIKNLPSAPDIQRLFKGVDIAKLSSALRKSEDPRAVWFSDAELVAYINSKAKLRELLVDDPTALEEAVATQPKVATFFLGTTVSTVRERYMRGGNHV